MAALDSIKNRLIDRILVTQNIAKGNLISEAD